MSKEEHEKVYNLLIKDREAFWLRDEIGACPNNEVDFQVTDKLQFFIRPFHVKAKDKPMMDKEMPRLDYLDILRKDMSPYSSPIILIAKKNLKFEFEKV